MWAGELVSVKIEANTPSFTGENVAKDDPRIRFLGGPTGPGPSFPQDHLIFVHEVSYNGSSNAKSANTFGFEFQLTGNSFEIVTLGVGDPSNWSIEVDGVATNVNGYPEPPNDGGLYYERVDLPVSTVPRRIRIVGPNRGFGGLILPTGATIATATPAYPTNVVFVGDSITEGSVASAEWLRWGSQASYRLGFDNMIVSAVGGSGYLTAIQDRNPGYPDYTFRQRIGDVLTAVNGGPPDAVIIAGGINDNGKSAAAMQAEALTYFQQLRAGAPNMVIIVLGPWTDYNNVGTDGYAVLDGPARDGIFAAAAQVPGVYTVDVSDWVTMSNRDYVFNGTVNGPHPIDSGHALYGMLAAQAIAKIINGLP